MVRSAITIADLRAAAKSRLPKILFDWVDGGAGDEATLRRNEEVFRSYCFAPRYLLDITGRKQTKSLFGQGFDAPFGIAPTGYNGLFRPGADRMLANAARAANIPMILSGSSTEKIEDVVEIAPDNVWYQLYGSADAAITEDLIRRAADAGCRALVITIDIPLAARRERDLRNGFSIPLKVTPKLVLDGLMHPRWTARYFMSGGLPRMANWEPYAPAPLTALQLAQFAETHSYCVQTWEHLERFRALWPRRLLVKGVMNPADARRAVGMGVDGLILSNHGGRQYDRSPAAIEVLPAIRQTVGNAVPVMVDGGIRRGSDILACLAMGADFVFAGRAMLFGVVAAGQPGAERAISILRDELDQLMGQVGCTDLEDLPGDLVFRT